MPEKKWVLGKSRLLGNIVVTYGGGERDGKWFGWMAWDEYKNAASANSAVEMNNRSRSKPKRLLYKESSDA